MNKQKMIEVCSDIAADAKHDATEFDGKEFNGKNVAEYFGNHGASIAALANMVKALIEEPPNDQR